MLLKIIYVRNIFSQSFFFFVHYVKMSDSIMTDYISGFFVFLLYCKFWEGRTLAQSLAQSIPSLCCFTDTLRLLKPSQAFSRLQKTSQAPLFQTHWLIIHFVFPFPGLSLYMCLYSVKDLLLTIPHMKS